jgi:hypothetical protein
VYPEQPNHAVVAKHLEHIAPTLVVITIGGNDLCQALLLLTTDMNESIFIKRLRAGILFSSAKYSAPMASCCSNPTCVSQSDNNSSHTTYEMCATDSETTEAIGLV